MESTEAETPENEPLVSRHYSTTEQERQRMRAQEDEIRDLLNQQSEDEFRRYAQTQHPNNPAAQEAIIAELQDQQFQQYMQLVYEQQLRHQQDQYEQLQALFAPAAAAAAPDSASVDQQQQQQLLLPTPTSPSPPPPPQQHQQQQHENCPISVKEIKVSMENGEETENGPSASFSCQTAVADAPVADAVHPAAGPVYPAAGPMEPALGPPPPILPASIWTRPNLDEFKAECRVDSPGVHGVIKVSSLDTGTIKVPTHPEGRYITWEFATDHYDLGFGVYFEWLIDTPDAVSIQTSESDDEFDDEDDDADAVEPLRVSANAEHGQQDPAPPAKPDVSVDPERGKPSADQRPIDEIVPIYRRDSHLNVYCGSHLYPGRGVYHLKFDNGFSLWRSKTVYYRVYYIK